MSNVFDFRATVSGVDREALSRCTSVYYMTHDRARHVHARRKSARSQKIVAQVKKTAQNGPKNQCLPSVRGRERATTGNVRASERERERESVSGRGKHAIINITDNYRVI